LVAPATGSRNGVNPPRTESERREVRAEDPALSAETNARLTAELREVVGRETAEVPASRPHAARGEHPRQHGFSASLGVNRFQLIRGTAIVLTFGLIVALATGKWWILPLAAGVHALGTMTVMMGILRITTVSERPSPQVAAAMSEEGVAHPDEYFSRMVEEFRSEPEHGTTEVLSPGFNERTVDATEAPADAAAEQSSAMTPTGRPSRPGGEGALPDALVWATSLGMLILSFVLPAAMGGRWLWLLPAVMVPLLAGWVLGERAMMVRGDKVQLRGRAPLVAIVGCTAIAVAIFCGVVAIAFAR
jgi:hypothetical protein